MDDEGTAQPEHVSAERREQRELLRALAQGAQDMGLDDAPPEHFAAALDDARRAPARQVRP